MGEIWCLPSKSLDDKVEKISKSMKIRELYFIDVLEIFKECKKIENNTIIVSMFIN